MTGLRERKKQHTRRVLIEAAYGLFERDGYQQTTVARIADAADVSLATFFNYFPRKEDLLFSDGDDLIAFGLGVIEEAGPQEGPVEVLSRAVQAMIGSSRGGTRDPGSALETRRVQVVMSVPELRGTMLERSFSALQELAGALRAAYPDQLDEVDAAAMVGAVFGAGFAAGTISVQRGDPSEAALTRSVDLVTQALAGLPSTAQTTQSTQTR